MRVTDCVSYRYIVAIGRVRLRARARALVRASCEDALA